MSDLTGLQLRAARALLRWRPQDLAKKSRVGLDVIKRSELLDGPVNMPEAHQQQIIRVLEMAGIVLIDDPDIGNGAAYLKSGPKPAGLIG